MISDLDFQTYDYAIGGKMVVGRAQLSESYRLMVEDGDQAAIDQVKERLIFQMAKFILENKLVEFTYQDNPIDHSRQLAIRAYLAPNDQVKILRLANKIV